MPLASVRARFWSFRYAAFALALAGAGFSFYPTGSAGPAGSAVPALQVATAETEAGSVRRAWLPAVFAPAHPDRRKRAAAQLEAVGLRLDGEAFVGAIGSGHRPLIDLFREAGIDVNATASDGRTALLTAALRSDWPLCTELLKAGAEVNRADAGGITPLMVVAAANRVTLLREMIEYGANLEAVDRHGHRAIHYAVAGHSLQTSADLLERGVECAGDCCPGHDLLEHAFDQADWRLAEPILHRLPPTLAWRPSSRSALMGSLLVRDVPRIRLLLSKHPAPPTPEGRAQPLLAYALAAGNWEQFRLLIECGADPNTKLNSPVEKAFSDVVTRDFLRHYLEEEPGMTVLMLAAGLGRQDCVQLLLDKGAKRGLATEKYKMPAVLFAARTDNAEVVQALIGECPKPEELRIEISLGAQRATVIKNGVPTIRTDVSTGKAGTSTPKGRFVVTDKHVDHRSTIYKVPMPYFMRLNARDFGMHQGHVPGYPASHGCIRLPSDMARRLFREIPVGTLVTIQD
jgi:ankyrin repeat protein